MGRMVCDENVTDCRLSPYSRRLLRKNILSLSEVMKDAVQQMLSSKFAILVFDVWTDERLSTSLELYSRRE